MPVLSFANTKGGSGKSTSALLLACELARQVSVTLIDADPRRPLIAWSKLAPLPARLSLINSQGERTIQDEIEEGRRSSAFTLIDLEGSASRLAGYAIGESDLVVIPSQEQHQDAQGALETLAEVRREGRARRREIPAVILFTRTKVAVKSRTNRHVSAQLREIPDLDVLPVELAERDAYSALFTSGGSLYSLDPKEVNQIDKAIFNSQMVAQAIVNQLSQGSRA
jgi:chromosome partitioning protein